MTIKNKLTTVALMVFISCGGFAGWNETNSYEKAKFVGHSTNIIYDDLMKEISKEIKILVDKHDATGLTTAEYKRLEDLRSLAKDKVGGYYYANQAYKIAMHRWNETGEVPKDIGIILTTLKEYADLFGEIADQYDLF